MSNPLAHVNTRTFIENMPHCDCTALKEVGRKSFLNG